MTAKISQAGDHKTTTSGVVVSVSGKQTRKVEVVRRVKLPIYGKYISRRSYFMVHDEDEASKVGDVVLFQETAPISKRKTARIISIREEK
jgi:small subunit ribosomal protein S17